jgi:hypothetical protein
MSVLLALVEFRARLLENRDASRCAAILEGVHDKDPASPFHLRGEPDQVRSGAAATAHS